MSAVNKETKNNEVLPEMPKNLLKKLVQLLNVQSESGNEWQMFGYLIKQLVGRGVKYQIDKYGNILITKGNASIYPCVVAHIDTVHDTVDGYKVIIDRGIGTAYARAKAGQEPVGVGGDDKNGIFAVLTMLDRVENMKAVFFREEETTMAGSKNVDMAFFGDVGYIFQLDRWGRSDFIDQYFGQQSVSESAMRKIANTMSEFGYKTASGLSTDVFELFTRGIGISVANISCGYYQHHSHSEFININQLWNSIRFLEKIISDLGENKYDMKYARKVYYGREEWFPLPSSYNNNYGGMNSGLGINTALSDYHLQIACDMLDARTGSKNTTLSRNGMLMKLQVSIHEAQNIELEFYKATGQYLIEDNQWY